MGKVSLPRYMRVAHWVHERQRLVNARELADAFGVSTWAISNDFEKIRKRADVINVVEQQVRNSGETLYLMQVLHIHPYRVDERQRICRLNRPMLTPDAEWAWRELLCRPWREMTLVLEG